MRSYNLYRNNAVVGEFVVNDTVSDALSGNKSVSFTLTSKNELDIKINDYILVDGVEYTLFTPVDVEEGNGVFTYPLTFYWPGYKLNFSLIAHEGATTFTYHGGVGDCLRLLLGSLEEDYPGFTLGVAEEYGILDLSFDNSNCMAALQTICEAAKMEWSIDNTTINVKKRTGIDTGHVFEYGQDKGGYSVKLAKVANASITTRLIGKGGTANLPSGYVSKDNPRRLNLGSEVLEKNVEKYGKITAVYVNDDIYPRLVNKSVLYVTRPSDIEMAKYWKLKLDIPFDLAQHYVGGTAPRVVFQTGDLTGTEFEIVENSWDNTDKTLSIIVREEGDGYRIPNKARQPRVGDMFVLLNVLMPQSYIDEATDELRRATQDELERKCEPQLAPMLVAQKHYLEKSGIDLCVGDSITVKVGSQSVSTRILGISHSSSNDEINFELGDQMLYSYDTKVNNTIQQIQTTLKQLITIEDIRRQFNILINAWYPAWFDQKLHAADDVRFNAVDAAASVSTNELTATASVSTNELTATASVKTTELTTEGISSGRFVSGLLGEGYRLQDGHLELDEITVRRRMNVFELLIQQIRSVGGQLLVTPGSTKIAQVEETASGYKCFFNNEGGTTPNPFVPGDQVIQQVFTGDSANRYWRLVESVGDNYFVLSKADCEADSGVPAVGDEVVQLGHRTDSGRQSAIMIYSYGDGAPCVAYYSGINGFSLAGKEVMREGNLNGIVDADLGQLSGFGLYAQNAYLKGVFKLMSGKTVEQSIADSVKEGVDNIQVGGRNLIGETNQDSGWNYAFGDNFPALTYEVKDKVMCARYDLAVLPTSYAVALYRLWNDSRNSVEMIKQYRGKNAVLSFEVFTTFDTEVSACIRNPNGLNKVFDGGSATSVRANEWSRIVAPGVLHEDEAYYTSQSFVYITGIDQAGTAYFRNLKLEAGNKASDWTPAPEDTQQEIDAAKLAASNALSAAGSAQQSVMRVTEQVASLVADNEGIRASVTTVTEKVDNVRPGTVNYLNGSRFNSLDGWERNGGTLQVVEDEKFGAVVEFSRPQGGGDFQKGFDLPRAELSNTELIYYVIAKQISNDKYWLFGGWSQTHDYLNPNTSNKIDLGDGWYQYWITFKSGDTIGSAFGINCIGGTWRFYAAGVLKGNKPAAWAPSLADQEMQAGSIAEAKVDKARQEVNTQLNVLSGQIAAKVEKAEYSQNNALINNSISQLQIGQNGIAQSVTSINGRLGTMENAGYMTTAQGNTLYAGKSMENGESIISTINQTAGAVKINAKNIDLNGVVTVGSAGQVSINEGKITAQNVEISGESTFGNLRVQGSYLLAKNGWDIQFGAQGLTKNQFVINLQSPSSQILDTMLTLHHTGRGILIVDSPYTTISREPIGFCVMQGTGNAIYSLGSVDFDLNGKTFQIRNGSTQFSGTVQISGAVTLTSTLQVSGLTRLNGGLQTLGALNLNTQGAASYLKGIPYYTSSGETNSFAHLLVHKTTGRLAYT